jgi:hypothetical protein
MAKTGAQKAMDKVMAVPAVAEELMKKVDPAKVNIWERRMVNPGRESVSPIMLREDGFTVRFINTEVQGRFHRAVYDQGWEAVKVEELRDAPDMLGLTPAADGFVRRGERGQEVLMKIPTIVFKQIQKRKGQIEMDSLRRTRQNLSEAAARQFGANAGEWASGKSIGEDVSGLKGRVVDYVETRVIDSEEEGGE